ncbi:MAG: hypothetical protein E7378_00045 [Clostridiales bacterium]|nr:hypothetical protein [Clostridiales bacterium]
MNYTKIVKGNNLRYAFIEFFNKNKAKIIIAFVIIIFTLLTGIFTAVKLYNLDKDLNLKQFSMYAVLNGNIYTFANFLLRILSALIVLGLLFLFSTTKYTAFLGYLLLAYRAMLLGINCALIILKVGWSGIFISLLIILPCQLLMLILMTLFFILAISLFKTKRTCGYIPTEYKKIVLAAFFGVLIVNLIEVLILFIFKPTTLLIV